MLYDRDIDPRLDRSRFANSLAYLDESQDGLRDYTVDLLVVNGAEPVLVYDLIRKNTSGHIVSVAGVRIEGWSISVGTGPAKSDQLTFPLAALPVDGAVIKVQYKKQGPPDGLAFGKRTPIEIDEDSDVQVVESQGWEKLYVLAGFADTYSDTSWWWVFVDVNPGLNGIWRSMLLGIPLGVELQYPSESEVLLQLEGELDE